MESVVRMDVVCDYFFVNSSGKSTLLKAIANGQVDGFPPQDQVRTFMVADELQSVDATTTIIDYMTSDAKINHHSKEKIVETLHSVGFSAEVQANGVGSLSGGWKMKLALARGILFEADILLLDEPTNHLYDLILLMY
jgi:elongation factor 3